VFQWQCIASHISQMISSVVESSQDNRSFDEDWMLLRVSSGSLYTLLDHCLVLFGAFSGYIVSFIEAVCKSLVLLSAFATDIVKLVSQFLFEFLRG
jgi:hypothetical protein